MDQPQKILKTPMLPMRNIVVFPHMTTPFFIGREQSIEALEEALAGDRQIFVIAQKDPLIEKPTSDDLYEIGTLGNILQIMRLPNGTIKALFEAKHRARRLDVDFNQSAYQAEIEILESTDKENPEVNALVNSTKDEFANFIKKIAKSTDLTDKITSGEQTSDELSDLIAPLLSLEIDKQQELLECLSVKERLEIVFRRMLEEKEHKKLEQKLKERVQGQIGKTQKEYYLNEQMKAIQKELGAEDGKAELDEYSGQLETCGISQAAREVAEKEIKKLKLMPPMSSEANIVRNYLDWLVGVPWKAETTDVLSIDHTQEVLDKDHYGLEKVKERIIEYIAVAKMVGDLRGPIICLVGPPGVGKTSLARSIASSVGRNFVRMSLGGVRDEAEIRGHRRTYIGALPGKIVQSMKKAKTNNPVLLLDEIDKMAQSHLGDPASALLEVLDPEQNKEFMDHYMEVEYDLSNVMFVCTANNKADIPLPLLDRLELIDLSGYTEIEKEKIASQYLVKKQITENGLTNHKVDFPTEGLYEVIRGYTREAGVRSLDRMIAKLCRKAATEIIQKETAEISLTPDKVNEYLGARIFISENLEGENEVGLVHGLAWTSVGGEVLTLEVNSVAGTGKILLTGKLGDVMKESAQAALSYIRANANSLGLSSGIFQKVDLHLHVPEGATPKDGPSAGTAITTAMVSALTNIAAKKQIAMTGEVTLRGNVLPIGGLKEKLLAAKRYNITTVLIPDGNKKDLPEIPVEIKEGLEIIPIKKVGEALQLTLESLPNPITEPGGISAKIPPVGDFENQTVGINPS